MPFLDTLKTGALLFTLIALVPPHLLAASGQVSLPIQSVALGGNAGLPVTFQLGSGPISGIQFDLQYDNTVMTLTATVGDAANNAGKTLYSADLTPNTKRFLITGVNLNAINTGTIVNLSVALNANGLLGTSPLTFSNVAGTDPNGMAASVTSSNGAVIIIGSGQPVLTTIVLPAGSGSIAANPASAGGSYILGTPVQLTATPAAGCTFTGWTGALTGALNPQTVIMLATQAVTANFQCGGTGAASFLTGYALSNPPLRNDASTWVGLKFTVGASPLAISSLGRICVANNAMTHVVKLVNSSTGSDVAGASASVNMAGCTPGQFVYGAVNSINLPAGAGYFLVSQEMAGGDLWYDYGSISTTNVAAVNSSVYFLNGWIPAATTNTSYVPVNFQYAVGTQYQLTTSVSPAGSGSVAANPSSAGGTYSAGTPVQLTATPSAGCAFTGWSGALAGATNPQTITRSAALAVTANFQCGGTGAGSFLTGYALNNPPLRNDASTWVGLKFTVGASPLAISSLGRICVANNAMTHVVKLVNSSSGSDVAGASASVNMAGCTPGQFVYGAVNSINLPAGAGYFLVSQETAGGDRWYDYGSISTTNVAAVNSSVYFLNGWIPAATTNTSYVPVNFQYAVGTQYQLTTSVSPAGSGSVAANPSSAGGTYSAGTPVQLTATPSTGCVFTSWSGALAGATNPQKITMSAKLAVTANFQCGGTGAESFLTGYALSNPPLRNDAGTWVGLKFTVGVSPLAISSLGRICVANNAMTHVVKLVNSSNGSDVAGASASVNMAGCTPGQFVYGAVNSINLPAGAGYFLVSQETAGGDWWYDYGSISTTSVAAVNSSVYFLNGWIPAATTNTSYVPVNFQYAVGTQYQLTTSVSPAGSGSIVANPSSTGGTYPAGTPVQLTAIASAGCVFTNWTGTVTSAANPQTVTMSAAQTVTANFQCNGAGPVSFLTGYALNGPPLRNDYTGWVGMKLTMGASPLAVSSLGRICVANNAATHGVKLVTASNGADVPNGAVTVSMAGCTPGQFVYAAVNSVSLQPGVTYLLVSQETAGGDRWYDYGSISTTNVAAVNSSVYFLNGIWIPAATTNSSYVPVNFLY